MQKLLTATLLLAGCTLHQASAQKVPLSPSTVASASNSPTPALHWAAAEFCEAYGHYYHDLPSLYRYNAGQALQHTLLAVPNADLAKLLTQQPDLREAVYKTIYQYCHTLKYGMDDQHEIQELVYYMLYHDLHMSSLAATHLAPHISSDYQQSVPAILVKDTAPATTSRATPGREQPQTLYAPKGAGESLNSSAFYGMPSSSRKTSVYGGSSLEMSGWAFDSVPSIPKIDDNPGVARFKIVVDDNGDVVSVSKVSGNISSEQAQAVRSALLKASFRNLNGPSGGTTGYYNFRFTVE